MTDQCWTTGPVVDPAALRGLRELQEEGEPDLLRELVELFEEDAKSRLTSLQEGIRQLDPLQVEREAHALKGGCSTFGAQPMVVACAHLEKTGRTGDLARAQGLLNQLLLEYDLVRAALAAELAGC